MQRLWPFVLVGLGGFAGANARYMVAKWLGTGGPGRFPLATFLINVSGSFLLGLLGTFVAQRISPHGDALLLALGVGFLGAYTTFSTFEYETHTLFENRSFAIGLAYVLASVAAGFVAVRAGVVAARWWLEP